MRRKSRASLVFFLMLACVGLDQLTKWWAVQNLDPLERTSYLGDTVRIQYAENRGAFLSLGNDLPESMRFWLLTLAVGALLVGMLLYLLLARDLRKDSVIALAFIVSGGFSNLLDRAYNDGAVIDFMNVGIGGLRTGIFNVADMAITFGVLWLLVLGFRKEPPTPAPAPGETDGSRA